MFNRIFAELAAKGDKPDQLMIDATHLKAQHTAASLQKRNSTQTYRAHQGRPELQAVCSIRWQWPSADHAPQRRTDERLQGRCDAYDAVKDGLECFPDALVALGSHSATGFHQATLGSNTSDILRFAEADMLVVNTKGAG